MTRTEFHVVPRGGSWVVEHEGRSLGVFTARKLAVESARNRAADVQPSRVVVHGGEAEIIDNGDDSINPPGPPEVGDGG